MQKWLKQQQQAIRLINQAFILTLKHYALTVRSSLSWVLPVAISCFFIKQSFIVAFQQYGHISDQLSMLSQVGIALADFIEAAFFLFILPIKMRDQILGTDTSVVRMVIKYGVSLVAEGLRALVRVLLGLILFIIPGLFLHVRYFFVPLVVIFDPRYERGEVDALKTSNSLVKGMTLPLLLTMLFLGAGDYFIDTNGQSQNVMVNPLAAISLSILALAVSLFGYCLGYAIYHLRSEHIRTEQKSLDIEGTSHREALKTGLTH